MARPLDDHSKQNGNSGAAPRLRLGAGQFNKHDLVSRELKNKSHISKVYKTATTLPWLPL
jgi:hypothetical protein